MKLDSTPQEDEFRREIAGWLKENFTGQFDALRDGAHGVPFYERLEWEKLLGKAGWNSLAWPPEHGGRGADLSQQIVYAEEYVASGAPPRVNHVGLEFVAPTLLAFGTEEQKKRFLPPLAAGEEVWAQLFSEPDAGSDLFGLTTRARLEGDRWVINGRKIWSSYAQYADWGALLCRTEEGSTGPRGISFLLVPLKQPNVEIRPIRQMTGDETFNEIFLDDAVTDAANILGRPGDGVKVAVSLLTIERGISMLGLQLGYFHEQRKVELLAEEHGRLSDPLILDRLAASRAELEIMRINAYRMLEATMNGGEDRVGLTYKLNYANWHQRLGELAMDILGTDALVLGAPGAKPEGLVEAFLHSRADSIYGGTNEIQRNLIAERGLMLPREK